MQIQTHSKAALLFTALLFSLSSMAQDGPKTEPSPAPVQEDSNAQQEDNQPQQDDATAETQPQQDDATAETQPQQDDATAETQPQQDDATAETQPQQDKATAETQPQQDDATYEIPATEEQATKTDADKPPDAKAPKKKLPFAKGDMAADLSVALAGSGNDFYLGVGATYGYYIADRFSLGLYVQYTHIFSDAEYDYKPPESLMFLPFVQFTFLRSKSVSPYIFVTGGYEGKWTYDAKEGYSSSPNGWLIGGGGGVYVGITKQVAINIRLLGAYKWYSNKQIYRYKDSDLYDNWNENEGGTYKCEGDGQCDTADVFNGRTDPVYRRLTKTEDEILTEYLCYDESSCEQAYDRKDKKSEGLFPLITIGVTVFF